MCFSAGASFGAATILSTIGVLSIKKAQSPSDTVFASIPMLFAIQQLAEGVLWLALSNPSYAWLQQGATYIFLVFAQVIWPLLVPVSILLLEKKEERKKVQKVLIGIGAVISVYLGFCLLFYNVQASIVGYHISYELDFPPTFGGVGSLLYVIATIVPPFFSSYKRMWTLGTAILISYIITMIFYTDYIISVWCFFASIISIAVLAIMYEIKKANDESNIPASLKSNSTIS